jgi:hypothetical protein
MLDGSSLGSEWRNRPSDGLLIILIMKLIARVENLEIYGENLIFSAIGAMNQGFKGR